MECEIRRGTAGDGARVDPIAAVCAQLHPDLQRVVERCEDIGNQGAHLIGKASDAALRAPGLSSGQVIDPRQGIAATSFYDQIKAFFTNCAGVLRGQGDAKGAERFAKASTHWMRHSHASHAIAGGMPIEIAQQNLGHASLATTTVYVTTEKRRRMKAVEAFWRK